ncbi:SWIB/MDM2 domain-containing protein [Chitinophaga japonensis]|uniref:SWIB/MDM2 domain-containing protein n=1 Tax=Chitinophaga japonensis TaxID=104662 RepID=A0A562TCB4_CHIJA|nr:SWIB/MDM2 domain-containing protein [Chitinophaga japonensis]TWI91135.1 SWIB/MDM2 domain-containing protein [Chitinophaga japonensis]
MAKTAKKATKPATKQPAKKAAAKKAAPKKAAAKKATGKTGSGLSTPVTPSAELASVVGNKAMPRTSIIKKIWDYIKEHDLQDKQNRRMINADSKLKPVFDGKNQISMFELAKVVNKHVQ